MVDDEVLEKLVKLGYKQPIKEKEVEIVEWIRVLSFSYIHLLIKKERKDLYLLSQWRMVH